MPSFEPVENDPFASVPTGGVTTIPGENGAPPRVIMHMGGGPKFEPVDHDPFATDYGGMAKAAGIGVAKGAIGLAGLPGDTAVLAKKGADYVASKMPDVQEPAFIKFLRDETAKMGPGAGSGARGDVPGTYELPTSQDIQSAVENNVTGKFREPQNQAERDAETVGEFVPAALMGGGGLARKAITQVAGPAAATIVAGRYSDQNPYVKGLAGFIAGGVGALSSGRTSAESILRQQLPDFVTEQHITRAGNLIDHALQRGVTLTWPEALSRVTGQPVLTDMQRIVESHPRTRTQMQTFMADRPQQVENAVGHELDYLGGRSNNPSMIGSQAAQSAEQTINGVRAAINRATRPSYDAAGQTLVPPAVHAAMRDDPLFVDALDAIRNDPARNSFVRGHSDRSVAVYDAVRKELEERAQRASNPIQPGHSQAVSSATGNMADTVRRVAIASDRAVSGGPGAVSAYEQALAQQAALRQQYLEPLMRGPLGRLAEAPDTERAIAAVFGNKSQVPGSEHEIRTAITALANRRPAVAEQLVRAHAEMVFNQAAKDLQSGGNQFAGAKFVKDLVGDNQHAQNLRAAVESLPNGQARWQGLESLIEVLAATGQRQPKGSLTAFNTLDASHMSGSGIAALAAKGASPGKWWTVANDAYKAWSAGQNLDQIARIITDPRSGDALGQISRIPHGSERALIMAGRLIAQLGAATTEQRLDRKN